VDIYGPAKFYPDRIRGFVAAHARFRESNCLLGYLFVCLLGSSNRTDFDAKYVKIHGSAQGCVFWGSQNQKLSFTPPFVAQVSLKLRPYGAIQICLLLLLLFFIYFR